MMEYPEWGGTHKDHPVQPLFPHRHPNNPTLCLSIVQTLLELWQPWGRAHSLGSLFFTLWEKNLSQNPA